VSGKLDRRVAALAEAVEVAEGRLEPGTVDAARAVVQRAGQRLGLGIEATVVALAGPTGAGKSSLFNALAGAELAEAGRLRPTTATATAALWGDPPEALLDWLEVPRRHHMEGAGRNGLVLLDLPDFDSVQAGHRLEVERLLDLVDLVVWVVDPQKYADAALHDRYLRPLASHRDTMVVVLNQADVLDAQALKACHADLRRLLADDGLGDVPLLAVSARTGANLDELQGVLDRRVARRDAAVARLAADVTTAATALGEGCGEGRPGKVGRGETQRVVQALSQAAGVPTVALAVSRSHRRQGALATGWPFVRWVRRLRPDPLKRLRLGDGPSPDVHTSLPGPTPVQTAQAGGAARELAADAAGELPAPWPSLVRSAATRSEEELPARLDRAVSGAELPTRRPRWWRVAGLLQALLALIGLGFLRIEDAVPLPEVWGIPLPTLLLGGGALAGLLLTILTRAVNRVASRRRARRATAAMNRRVETVARELVIEPVEAELAAHERLCAATSTALRG